jgi:hypothetical protein
MLGTHMSAGRLTVAEYDERLTRTYAARAYGELAGLTTDLPAQTTTPGTPAAAAAAGHSGATTATRQPAPCCASPGRAG